MLNTNDKKALRRFGQHLADLRKEKSLSLRDVSSACDIDNSKIAKIEKGMINITFTTIIELAAGLDVHPKKLFDYEE
ncbi:MAG TPA: helix-turn-helix transcriptional regulator [Chitinophagaceae bacterium]